MQTGSWAWAWPWQATHFGISYVRSALGIEWLLGGRSKGSSAKFGTGYWSKVGKNWMGYGMKRALRSKYRSFCRVDAVCLPSLFGTGNGLTQALRTSARNTRAWSSQRNTGGEYCRKAPQAENFLLKAPTSAWIFPDSIPRRTTPQWLCLALGGSTWLSDKNWWNHLCCCLWICHRNLSSTPTESWKFENPNWLWRCWLTERYRSSGCKFAKRSFHQLTLKGLKQVYSLQYTERLFQSHYASLELFLGYLKNIQLASDW